MLDGRNEAPAPREAYVPPVDTIGQGISRYVGSRQEASDLGRAKTAGPLVMSADNPDGWKLEDLLVQVIEEVARKQARIQDDHRPAAYRVYGNNIEIIRYLQCALVRQQDSVRTLAKVAPDPGPRGTPRIGEGSNP